MLRSFVIIVGLAFLLGGFAAGTDGAFTAADAPAWATWIAALWATAAGT